MTTEQKIREAYEIKTGVNHKNLSLEMECHYDSFKAGYLALLNSLEEHNDFYVTCYRLPEGVER